MICRILLLLTTASLSFAQSRERGHFSLQGVPATCMAIDPKPKSVLIAFSDGGICVFPADQRIVNVFTYPIHKKAITGACFMPDGKAFVTCSTDGMLRIWDTAAAIKRHKEAESTNGNAKSAPPPPLHTVKAHSGYGVNCVAVSPNGKRIATGATDGTVKVWDAGSLKQLHSLAAAHLGGVKSVQFSPDGKMLASGGNDKTAKLWDITAGKPVLAHKLEGHSGPVYAVAFSPDSKHLGTGSGVPKKSGYVQIWDTGTGKAEYKLEGHNDVVTSLVFHPKTDHLASGGADKVIRIWNLKEKKTEYTDEQGEPLRNLVIPPDASRLGTCSDHAVFWWVGFGK